uniref:Uncharacterized protein n=1 Tax=Nannochloropsis gaditana (strain CCMP526) TaxID=1093141 RepID=I2CPF8_NANGC
MHKGKLTKGLQLNRELRRSQPCVLQDRLASFSKGAGLLGVAGGKVG